MADALKDYLAHYSVEGKGLSVVTAIINGRILPALGDVQVERLTTKRITDWFHGLANAPMRRRTRRDAEKHNLGTVSSDPDYIRRRRATANRVMTVLRAAMNHAWREGKVADDSAWCNTNP